MAIFKRAGGYLREKEYHVIEPPELANLRIHPKHYEFVVAVLYWLVECISVELQDQLHTVELDVICVTDFGAKRITYPAIGVCYRESEHDDVGPLVQAAIQRLLRDKTVLDLIKFIVGAKRSWHDVTAELMVSQRHGISSAEQSATPQ